MVKIGGFPEKNLHKDTRSFIGWLKGVRLLGFQYQEKKSYNIITP